MSATQDLFNQVVDGLWSALDRTRSQAAGVLEGLGPEPGFGGTVLDGRLRQTLSPAAIAAGDPAVAAIIQGLTALLPNPGADGVPVSLHGFDPGDGQPRGLALVFRTPAPGTTIVAALTGAGAANIAFELAAVGSGTIGPTTLSLAAGWSLDVGGNVAGGGRLEFPRGGPAQVLDGAAPISITLTLRHAGDQTVLGPDEGPHVSVSGAAT